MATYTSHYNLKKPALADKIRIADFNGNADTIDSTMYENASLGAKLKADIGIVENTNTATHNISAGQYVIWKGDLYTASSAISSGATLSTANLAAVSGGGLNALNSNIKYQEITITLTSSTGRTISQNAGWSGYKLISATFVQNDDLYYTCVTDGIYPIISITSNDQIQLLGMNKNMQTSANRNLKILCVYKAV